jgi:tetratricopeptide (TPR) repeat protein
VSLLALAAGASALRALYFWELWPTPLFSVVFGDGRQYVTWAQEIAGGRWLGSSVFYQAPLYPYALALLFKAVGPSLGAVRVAQLLLGVASCLMLAHAGRRFVGDRAGLAAGWLLALYPPAIFFDGLIQKSSLDLFLVTALLALFGELTAGRAARPSNAAPIRRAWLILAASGAVLGLFILNRENARVLYPVAALWTWWFFRDEAPRVRAAWVGVFTASLLAIVVPVGVRNYVVGGEFLLSTSQLGANFYIGNHAGAQGSYEPLVAGHGNVAFERDDATRIAEQAAGHTLSPGSVSNYWMARAVADIRAQPGAWLALLGRKLLLSVNAAEVVDTESLDVYAEYSRVLGTLSWFSFGVLLPLAALGAWLARARWRSLLLPYAMAAVMVVSVALFYVLARYRFPVVPLLVLPAGAAVAAVADGLRSWRSGDRSRVRALWPGLALAATAAIVANLPLAAAGDDTLLNVGEELVRAGRPADARPFLARAAAASPDYAPARFNLGVALGRLGEKLKALEEFQAAVRLAPSDADAQAALALALQESGDLAQALPHFREAARLRPGDPKARFNLANALQQSGLPREAVPEYEAALRLKPGYVEALGNLAVALAASGDAASAIARLTDAARLEPGSAPIHFNLAELLTDANRPGEALVHYERAAALSPDSIDLQFALAQACARANRWSEALASLQKAAALARAAGRDQDLQAIEAAIRQCQGRR